MGAVDILGKKYLAFATSGEQFKDPYRVTGRSVVRLVKADGHFDYELHLDVTAEEIPF